jgi:hypothetical protein
VANLVKKPGWPAGLYYDDWLKLANHERCAVVYVEIAERLDALL